MKVSTEKVSSLSKIILTYTGLFLVVGTLILSCEKHRMMGAISEAYPCIAALMTGNVRSLCLLLDTRCQCVRTLELSVCVYHSFSTKGEKYTGLSVHDVRLNFSYAWFTMSLNCHPDG